MPPRDFKLPLLNVIMIQWYDKTQGKDFDS